MSIVWIFERFQIATHLTKTIWGAWVKFKAQFVLIFHYENAFIILKYFATRFTALEPKGAIGPIDRKEDFCLKICFEFQNYFT